MQNNNIPGMPQGLRKVPFMIYGNPQSNAGYNPIFYFNKPTFSPPGDSSPAGMQGNNLYFTVSISPSFVNIVLIQNNVASAGATREGILKFAMAIPKGFRLQNNASPYEVLSIMRDTFVDLYMEPYRLGNISGYRFKSSLPAQQPLDEVLNKFSLEPANLPHRVMAGQSSAFLYVPQSKMSEFFSDLQYPEFSQFKEIVVGEQGALSPAISVPSIPRRPIWKLFVNNLPASWNNINDIYHDDIQINSGKDPRFFDNAVVTFKIDDARKGAVPYVSVDEVHELVNVILNPTPKTKTIPVIIEGLDAPDSQVALNNLSFFVNNRPISPVRGVITLKGPDILANVTARFNGRNFEILNQLCDNTGLHIQMKSLRKMKNAGKPGSISSDGLQADGNIPLVVNIVCPSPSPDFNFITIDVSSKSGDIQSTFHKSLNTSVSSNPGMVSYKAPFSLPDNFIGQVSAKIYSVSKKQAEKHLNLNDNLSEINLTQKDFKGNDFISKLVSNPILVSLYIVILLAIIGGGGWLTYKYFFQKEEVTNTLSDSQQSTDTESDDNWFTDDAQWKSIDGQLKDPGLTFNTVEEIHNKIQAASANPDAAEFLNNHKATVDLVNTYMTIIQDIRSGDPNAIKTHMAALNDNHQKMLMAANDGWWDDNGPHYYTADGVQKANNKLKENASIFSSFSDVDDIHIGLEKTENKNDNRRKDWLKANPNSSTDSSSTQSSNKQKEESKKKKNSNSQGSNSNNGENSGSKNGSPKESTGNSNIKADF